MRTIGEWNEYCKFNAKRIVVTTAFNKFTGERKVFVSGVLRE